MFLRFLDRLINHEWMDCPPSGYSFTQDDETKDIFFVLHSWWHTSAPMEKEKKKEMREKEKFPQWSARKRSGGGVPRQAFPSGCLLQCIRCSLNTFSKAIL